MSSVSTCAPALFKCPPPLNFSIMTWTLNPSKLLALIPTFASSKYPIAKLPTVSSISSKSSATLASKLRDTSKLRGIITTLNLLWITSARLSSFDFNWISSKPSRRIVFTLNVSAPYLRNIADASNVLLPVRYIKLLVSTMIPDNITVASNELISTSFVVKSIISVISSTLLEA